MEVGDGEKLYEREIDNLSVKMIVVDDNVVVGIWRDAVVPEVCRLTVVAKVSGRCCRGVWCL